MRSITNIFENSTIKTAYRTTNNIFNLLASEKQTSGKSSGIYKLTCNTCNRAYIGQTGRMIGIRYKEHTSDISKLTTLSQLMPYIY